MKISNKAGHVQDWITQVWVKATGRKFSPEKVPWLMGPIGDIDIIKDKFIYTLAKRENLHVEQNLSGTGLLETFDDLQLTGEEKKLLHPKVIDFYEKTSNYNLRFGQRGRVFSSHLVGFLQLSSTGDFNN